MSQQLQITGGAKVRDLQDVIIGTSGVLSSLAFNVANGVPKLDVNGKILVSQLPNSVMEYQGTWNAATNTPTLVNGTGNQGDVYLCNVAGTTNFGAGPITFAVGDSAIYSGTIWQRAGGATGTVTSVGLTSTGNDAITITGSPITTSGNINLGFAGTNLQYINGAGDLTTFPTLISSIGLTMPSAFSVANSPLTSNGTIAVTGAGYPSQYIRGDGTLADFPTSGGGGSSVSYYLNGGTSQGTIGGVTYYEMSKTADTGTGVDFTKSGDGFIVAFLTDAGDPAQLNIPAGNWNYEIYASMSANGGTPEMYAELYKYDGTTFTLISTSSNEILYDGTNLNLYTFAMTVPSTTLAITDRLAIKLYATNSGGKTTTVHTQDSHLCQVITTFSTGITALNGLTAQVQYFATGTSGTDFNISSTTATHTFNLPVASASNTGKLSSTDWSTFNGKVPYTGATGSVNLGIYDIKTAGTQLKDGQSFTPTLGYTSLSSVSSGVLGILGLTFDNNAGGATLQFTRNVFNTYNFPNASGTLALLQADQIFTGINSFDYGINYKTGASLANVSGYISQAYATSGTGAGSTLSLKISDGNSVKAINLDFVGSPATYTYTFPSASGTIALTSQLGSYLPLAGGIMTGSILLNNNLTISGQLFGTSSYASMLAMSPSDKVLIDNSGRGVIFGGTIGQGAYTYTFPSASGTLALTSDLGSYVTLSTTQTITAQKSFSNLLIADKGVILATGSTTFLAGSTTLNGNANGLTIGLGVTISGTTTNYAHQLLFPQLTPQTYTYPAASGTLALTSNLSAYLPLTGGTLTGVLNGTTAAFSDSGTSTNTNLISLLQPNLTAYNGPILTLGKAIAINNAAAIQFYYTSSGSSSNSLTLALYGSTGLTIYGNGNGSIAGSFGIGTTSPSYTLDVSGTGRFTGNVTAQTGEFISGGQDGATGSVVRIGTTNTNAAARNWGIVNTWDNYGDLTFRVSNAQGGNALSAGSTKMVILSSGNVGIGTSSPAGKVDIAAGTGANILIAADATNLVSINNYSSASGFQDLKIVGANQLFFTGTAGGGSVTERMRITSAGNLNFNTAGSGAAYIQINQATGQDGGILWLRNNTTKYQQALDNSDNMVFYSYAISNNAYKINSNGSATLYGALTQNASDRRLKNNITNIPNALDKIKTLNGVTFNWENNIYKTERTNDIGVIAQEVQSVLPEAVALAPFDIDSEGNSKSGENYLTVYYEKLIPLLIEGIKELKTKNDTLESTIQNLQEQINILAK